MRRFIAGAVCPECRAVDRIVLEQEGALQRRRCVSCGYTDTLVGRTPAEPPTRLSRHRGEAPATPVRIVDPGRGDDAKGR